MAEPTPDGHRTWSPLSRLPFSGWSTNSLWERCCLLQELGRAMTRHQRTQLGRQQERCVDHAAVV